MSGRVIPEKGKLDGKKRVAIGQKGTIQVGELEITVFVSDLEKRNRHWFYLVTPAMGQGRMWVDSDNFTKKEWWE